MAILEERADVTRAARLVGPAWMLVVQILLWVPAVAIVLLVPDLPLEPTADWSAAVQDGVRVGWVAHQVAVVGAFLVGLGALAVVAGRAPGGGAGGGGGGGGQRGARVFARVSIALAVVAGVLAVTYGALRVGLLGVAAPRMDDVAAFRAAGLVAWVLDPVTLAAVACGGLALRRAGLVRRTGLVVAVVSALLIPFGLFKPPFVYGILLLALGIPLLRATYAVGRGRHGVPPRTLLGGRQSSGENGA